MVFANILLRMVHRLAEIRLSIEIPYCPKGAHCTRLEHECDTMFVTELCVLRTFEGVNFSLIFICAKYVPDFFGTDCAQVFNFPSCPNVRNTHGSVGSMFEGTPALDSAPSPSVAHGRNSGCSSQIISNFDKKTLSTHVYADSHRCFD